MRTIDPIAHIRTDFPEKFGIPRQSGLVEALTGTIVFEPMYRDLNALRGLEDYSHLWLIWDFSEVQMARWSPTVKPPRLGGNRRMGVFATRSPFRPNRLGLSCVRLQGIDPDAAEGPVIYVCGVDLMDGTPIFDIKPYLPHVDSHPEAAGGFAGRVAGHELQVDFPDRLLMRLPEDKRQAAIQVLRQDPRPGYRQEGEQVYGLSFAGYNIRFAVRDGVAVVLDVAEG